ncbi:MAG: PAS domain-containing protein, partial [Bacteroidetes bacterium]|nr:PAS domain-containing protein [Bacteroidota bacterium]
MNRLLERQLKRSGVEYSALPESVRRFVDEVGRSYDHHDADRALTERSIELSSQELVEANRRLAKEAKNQAALLENLRSAIAALSSGDDPVLLPAGFNAADPVALSDFLIQQFTRKHEAEETVRIYEMAVRSTSDGIVISDATRPDNPIIFCNQAFLQTTGYPAEEVIGKNCRFLQAEDKDQPGLQVIREAITNRLGCHVRIRNYRRSGEMFWNDFRLSPVFDAQQQLRFYVGVQTDVTADVMKQELATTLLAQRQELLHVAEEILAARTETEIVHTVVHRLGNLLPYDTASIYMTDAAAGVLRPIALLGPRWTSPDLDAWTIPEGTGIIGSIIRSGKGELINNAHRDPRSRYPDGATIATEHLVVHPLRTGEYVWGAFAVNRMSDRQFTDEEFEVLQFLASYGS